MAEDRKYGKVTLERGTIREDEPVVVFRGQDKLLPKVLAYYHLFCLKEGSPKEHLDLILSRRKEILIWQGDNKTKVPD
jgi:hypothetical protein